MRQQKGITAQKCPGCGEENARRANEVCTKCLSAIHLVRVHEENYERAKKDESLGYMEAKIHASWSHPRFRTFRSNQLNPHLAPIGVSLAKIARFLGVSKAETVTYGYLRHLENRLIFEPFNDTLGKQERLYKKPGDTSPHSMEATVLIPKELFSLLNNLFIEIDTAIVETEKAAVEYGKNALIMLNDGHLSVDEFNKK